MVEHLVGDTEGAAPTAAPPKGEPGADGAPAAGSTRGAEASKEDDSTQQPEGEQQPDEADETGSKGDRKQRSGTAATR
jgi:hypothetical protein